VCAEVTCEIEKANNYKLLNDIQQKFNEKTRYSYMGFLVKNLDLDSNSNIYNLKNASKKLVKYYETYPNSTPYS
jgi:hypothetical protein